MASIIASVLASVVALLSALFAGLAWRTSHQELRLDLYNRRFEIYSRALDMFHAIQDWEPTELETSSASLRDSPGFAATQKGFIKASREAGFLFSYESGIQKLLEQMSADVIGIIGYKRDMSPKIQGQTEMVLKAYAEFQERTELMQRFSSWSSGYPVISISEQSGALRLHRGDSRADAGQNVPVPTLVGTGALYLMSRFKSSQSAFKIS